MKTLALETEMRPLSQLLAEEKGVQVIYLTQKGRARFALVSLDEGDEEVMAIRRNKRLMARLDEYQQRALRGPRKTLEQIKKQFGLNGKKKKSR
ncbi:MAG: hypothetical protein L0Y72_31065 [Gemmataceae bacterium]|nr:hypothetical protein [Gemmataceae bacterium]MCI0743491.1 hypothetical protein [Gemmataceae bacterium]